jgi:hypothetical protein
MSDNSSSSIFVEQMSNNITVLLWVILIMSITCVFWSMVIVSNDNNITYKGANFKSCNCHIDDCTEHFDNNFVSSNYQSNYQSIPLTSPDTTQNSPSNMTFGQVIRHITNVDDYILEIYANLYILNGNILNISNDQVTQFYQAYLIKEGSKPYPLGKLIKDGDGIYKLKIKKKISDELLDYNYIFIAYEKDGEQSILLQGKFK